MAELTWAWCPLPGPTRTTKLTVDENSYGDGYSHRSTRGLNPARPSWRLDFPFTSAQQLADMDAFLTANAAAGFWFEAPDMGGALVFVTVDEWSAQVADRTRARTIADIVGTLSATFNRSFNPQPINPLPLAGGNLNIVQPTLNAAPPPVASTPVASPPPSMTDGTMTPTPTPFPDVPQQPPEVSP